MKYKEYLLVMTVIYMYVQMCVCVCVREGVLIVNTYINAYK